MSGSMPPRAARRLQIGPPPVAALTDLFSRGVDTVIGMQQHLLTLAARQTDEWIDATKSGTPFADRTAAVRRLDGPVQPRRRYSDRNATAFADTGGAADR